MAKIFISYARKDKDEVYPIVDELERNRFDCWIDKEGIESGSEFESVILDAIDTCEVFLHMLSVNSKASDYVREEYKYAVDVNKKVVSIALKGSMENPRVMFGFNTKDLIDINNKDHKEKLFRNLKKWCGSNENVKEDQPKTQIFEENEKVTNQEKITEGITGFHFSKLINDYIIEGTLVGCSLKEGDNLIKDDRIISVTTIYTEDKRNKSASPGQYIRLLVSDVGRSLKPGDVLCVESVAISQENATTKNTETVEHFYMTIESKSYYKIGVSSNVTGHIKSGKVRVNDTLRLNSWKFCKVLAINQITRRESGKRPYRWNDLDCFFAVKTPLESASVSDGEIEMLITIPASEISVNDVLKSPSLT